MLKGTGAMVLFRVTDKGNPSHMTLFYSMQDGPRMNELALKESGGEFLLYQSEDGQVKLEVRLQNETVWVTQQMIAELFQTTVPNISMHILPPPG